MQPLECSNSLDPVKKAKGGKKTSPPSPPPKKRPLQIVWSDKALQWGLRKLKVFELSKQQTHSKKPG